MTPLSRSEKESAGARTQPPMKGWPAQDPLAQPREGHDCGHDHGPVPDVLIQGEAEH
ncbi:UNVERIFIED_CONTAM: hypothetical protein Sradi_4142600 [Sesamum radiatum]|uniref:Uncharacterized protein n=1 Tax=Sesamum radiatum TaxID=300843 RepID=A0AAW2P275_SESRA